MGNYSYKKGVEDGKKGNPPDLMSENNSASDYIFFTTASKEQRKESNDDYKRGYEAGTRLHDSDESSSNDGGSGK